MATRTWTRGAGSGDWDVAANWEGAAVPVTNDIVIFRGSVAPPTTNLDQGAVDLDALIVARDFTGALGASGTELMIAADLVHYRGSGDFYYQHASHVDTLFTDLIIIDGAIAANSALAPTIEISSEEGDNDKISHIMVRRGAVTIGASNGNMPRLTVGSITNPQSDASVTYAADTATLAKLVQTGGRVSCTVAITDATVDGGTLVQETTYGITNLVMTGGMCQYKDDATITLADLHGGVLDLLQSPDTMIITTTILHPGSDLIYDTALHTLTNFYDLRRETR